MDKNNMNKVITDRNNGAVKVMYIIMLCYVCIECDCTDVYITCWYQHVITHQRW